MNTDILVRKYESYLTKGKEALKSATDYLHEHCADWDSSHEENWRRLIHIAENNLIAASALADVAKGE